MAASRSKASARVPTDGHKQRISIVIVDGEAIVREGVRMILDNDPGMHVVGEADGVEKACEVVSRVKPDVILIDLHNGADSPLDHLGEILRCSPLSKILVLTGRLDEDSNRRAAEQGAKGVIPKSQAAATLLTAIRKVDQGEVWFDRAFTARLLDDAARRVTGERPAYGVFSNLTPRERDVVLKIGDGLVNKDIAHALGISEKTVRNCLTTVYEKLGVTNRLELALLFARHNGSQAK